jgi:hypothetical protein
MKALKYSNRTVYYTVTSGKIYYLIFLHRAVLGVQFIRAFHSQWIL